MPFTCDVAGDVNGTKRNLRVQFLAPPALHDITRAAESLFTVLMQSDAAAEREAGATGTDGNDFNNNSNNGSSGRLDRRSNDLRFTVESVAILDEGRDVWTTVQSGSQVFAGCQLYCFRPKVRTELPMTAAQSGARSREGGGRTGTGATAAVSSVAEFVPFSSSPPLAGRGLNDATAARAASVVVVDAVLVNEVDPDGPGAIPAPERVVMWGRSTATAYQEETPTMLRKEQRALLSPRSASPEKAVRAESDCAEASERPQPYFLRPTTSSLRKKCPNATQTPSLSFSASDSARRNANSTEVQLSSCRREQEEHREQQRKSQQQPDLLQVDAEKIWDTLTTSAKQVRERAPRLANHTRAMAAALPSPSPFPIPPAAEFHYGQGEQAPPDKECSCTPSAVPARQEQLPPRVGFCDKMRLVFAALPTEEHRSFFLLRDLFHFAKMHGLLSREYLLQEQRARHATLNGFHNDARDVDANRSPFFIDRLRDSFALTLEGVLRTADVNRDGCVSYQEWMGLCLENPQLLELFFLFFQHGGGLDDRTDSLSCASSSACLPASSWGGSCYRDPSAASSMVPLTDSSGQLREQWERTHLMPARRGPPRCEACNEIADRDLWGLLPRQRRPPTGEAAKMGSTRLPGAETTRFEKGEGSLASERKKASQCSAKTLVRMAPYPSAMPSDDFSRHVQLMSVCDALKR